MRKIAPVFLFTVLLLTACSGDKTVDNSHGDSIHDTISTDTTDVNDSAKQKFRKLVSALPVPFEILNRFSGAHLPFQGDLLNAPDNASVYTGGDLQAINLGIYGADIAYMISQDKLGESAPFMKSIRTLSDAIVTPTAFDQNMIKRFEDNKSSRDSMQTLVHTSYTKIDSTLMNNDRLLLASLVIYGGWIESIYLTTKHIGNEKQNAKNKVLYDMLTMQQPYIDDIADLLTSFTNDSTALSLSRDMMHIKSIFPTDDMTPDQFSEKLHQLLEQVSATRAKLITIQ